MKKELAEKAAKGILAVACLVLVAISVTVFKASAAKLLLFAAYFILYIQIPGYAFNRWLKADSDKLSSGLLTGMFTGWALIVAEYFICELIGNNLILFLAGPAISLVFSYHCFRNRSDIRIIEISKLSVWVYMFVFLSLLYTLLKTQYRVIAPEAAEASLLFKDIAYHAGLINSLADGYPLLNPWLSGDTIYYHVFTEILCAVSVRLFGLDSAFIVSSALPLLTVYAVCLAVYAGLRATCSNDTNVGLCTVCFALSGAFIVNADTDAWLYRLIMGNYNYAGFALAGVISVLLLLCKCFGDSPRLSTHVILALQIAVLTGIKGPAGLIMVCSMWGAWILGMLLRSCSIKSLIPLSVSTAAFAFVYKIILSDPGTNKGVSGSSFEIGAIAGKCFWKPLVTDAFNGMGLPKPFTYLAILLVFGFFFFTIYYLPVIVGYIREFILVVTKRKDFDFTKVTAYAAFLAGLILMLMLKYNGRSQIYFGVVSFAVAPLITAWYFEDTRNSENRFARGIRRLTGVYFIICTAAFGFIVLADDISSADRAVRFAKGEVSLSEYELVTEDEYEGLMWIKANTPNDSLLAVDRYNSAPPDKYDYTSRWDNCFFTYAVYADRRCYFEGAGFNMKEEESELRKEYIETNNRLYNPDNPGRGQLADELGVDYVVVSKRTNDCGRLDGSGYTEVFDNKDMTVYEVS